MTDLEMSSSSRALWFAVALGGSLWAGDARAADDPTPDRDMRWYGWQIAIADAATGGLIFWGIESERAALVYGGLSGFLVIPPAIHGAHDSSPGGGAVLASFGTRLLVPTVMILSGLGGRSEDGGGTGVDQELDEEHPRPSLGLMFFVSAMDIAIFSVPTVWNPPPARRAPAAGLRPRILLRGDCALFGAVAEF